MEMNQFLNNCLNRSAQKFIEVSKDKRNIEMLLRIMFLFNSILVECKRLESCYSVFLGKSYFFLDIPKLACMDNWSIGWKKSFLLDSGKLDLLQVPMVFWKILLRMVHRHWFWA